MTVASGVIPYQYAGIYPFRVPDNHSIGFSGILFEQAMMVHSAEIHRHIGSNNFPKTYNKYTNQFSSPIEFTPLPDGANLDGRVDGIVGAMAYADYIAELRLGLSSLALFYSIDLGNADMFTDWLLWVGSTSGTQGQFTRIEFPLGSDVGIITSADPFDLGASGILWDIDLREVSFQPYSRAARGGTASYNRASIGLAPFFPNFMSTNGGFVKLNSREQALSFSSVGYIRTSQDFLDHEIIFDGDMFFSDTNFCLVDETATRDNLEGSINNNFFSITSLPGRIFRANADDAVDPRASARFSPVTLSPGGYGIGAINNLASHPYLVVPSGTASFYPSVPYNGAEVGAGFHVFDTSVWIEDYENINPNGLRLMNPFSKNLCWFRLADQTSQVDSDGDIHNWRDQHTVGLMKVGTSYLKVATFKNSSSVSDTKMGFMYYDDSQLDVTFSVPSQDWTVFGAAKSNPGECKDACTDGTSVYVYTFPGNGPFRNIFIFAGETLTDSKFIIDAGLAWIQAGVFGTGAVYGCDSDDVMFELIIDSDPGNDEIFRGTEYTFDRTAPGFPGSSGPGVVIYPPGEITGVPGFTDGTWMLVEQSDNIFMVRVILSGTDIIPQEGFSTDLPVPVQISERAGYRFVVGNFT